MANSTISNFTIQNDEFHTTMVETLAENLNAFNAASANAIQLVDESIIGDYRKYTVFDQVSSLVGHRDNTSTSSQTDLYMEDSEQVTVKHNLKYGPVKFTNDQFRKLGYDPALASSILGKQIAESKMQYLLARATAALRAKLSNTATVTHDITTSATDTLNPKSMAKALAKFGDRAGDIVCWVMHSTPFFDLVGNAIDAKIYEEAGMVVYGGLPGTLGRPVVVTDTGTGLYTDVSGSADVYYTLGLTAGAMVCTNSEADDIVSDLVTGEENLSVRIQGEGAVNFEMRNVKWGGSRNPSAADLETHTNWTALFSDKKLLPGVCLISN